MILAVILDFVDETEKMQQKNYQANSPGPIGIMQIFGNNLRRGFRVRAETKCSGSRRTQQKNHIVAGDLNFFYQISDQVPGK